MKNRTLGKTNFKVSVIGFGGFEIQKLREKDALKTLEVAVERGIKFFDTARGYTNSEKRIGKIKKLYKEDLIVATKISSPYPEIAKSDIEKSLRNLNSSCIDLLQIHCGDNFFQYNYVMKHTLSMLKKSKTKGKINFIGIVGNNPTVLMKAIKTGEFDTVLFPYNLSLSYPYNDFTYSIEKKLIPLAKKLHVGTICMQPLSYGILSCLRDANNFGIPKKFTPSQIALSFIVSNKNIHTTIPGMTSIKQVIENSAVGNDKYVKLTKKQKNALSSAAREITKDICRQCGCCMPCPSGVDIPNVFKCLNFYYKLDMKNLAYEAYEKLNKNKESANFCNKCAKCEVKCPFDIKIVNKMIEAKNIFAGDI